MSPHCHHLGSTRRAGTLHAERSQTHVHPHSTMCLHTALLDAHTCTQGVCALTAQLHAGTCVHLGTCVLPCVGSAAGRHAFTCSTAPCTRMLVCKGMHSIVQTRHTSPCLCAHPLHAHICTPLTAAPTLLQPPAPLPGTVPPLQPPLPTGNSSSAPLSHWAARLGGTKQHSAESQPAAPRPSPPCSPDLNTTQEQGEPLLPRTPQPPCNHPPPPSCSLLAGGFEARPPVRGVQSRSLSVKLPPPARCRAPPRAVPLRWSFTSRPRAAPGQLLPYIPMGPVGGGSPRVPHVERNATLGDVAGSTQSTEPPHCTPTPRRAHSAGPTGTPCPKSPPQSGEQEPGPPRVRQEGTPRARCSPCSPDGLIRRSQSSACLPPRPPHPMRRSASLGRGTGGTAGIRGRERAATLRHGAVPESSF